MVDVPLSIAATPLSGAPPLPGPPSLPELLLESVTACAKRVRLLNFFIMNRFPIRSDATAARAASIRTEGIVYETRNSESSICLIVFHRNH